MNYWTCLVFEGHHPKDFHCTHKFLGELQDDTLAYVLITVNFFIEELKSTGQLLECRELRFNKRDFFGEAGDIPVLLPDGGCMEIFKKLSLLRSELDKFRDDDYGEYRPHVTTDEKNFLGRVVSYAVMRDEKILAQWPISP